MGNNNVTPVKHSIETYSSFINGFLDDKAVKKLNSDKNLQSKVDHEFSTFVDDFIVNDKQFQKYAEKGQQICLACLLFIHSTVPYESFSSTPDLETIPFADSLVNLFNDGLAVEDALAGFLVSKYVWDGSSFFEWSDQVWTRCSEDSLSCSEFINGAGLETPIRTCGLTQDLVTSGVSLFNEYRKSLLSAAESFNQSETFTKTVKYIKSKVKKFDQGSALIPCYSGAVDVTKGSQRSFNPDDAFLTKLSYDPAKDTTKLVSKFVSRFNCDSTDLATTLVRCGVSVGRSLTVVSGPKNSGKSTVLKVVKALYGPFVCTQEEFEAGNVNTDLVRTCLIDNSSFLSEEKVSSHPISNLVVTCESSILKGLFGGRKVKTVVLSASLGEDDVKIGIVTNLSTRKQLGSLLGWALQKYDLSSFVSQKEGSGSSSWVRTFMGEGGMSCADPDSKGCGDGSMSTGMDVTKILMKVFMVGPNGIEDDLSEAPSKEDSKDQTKEVTKYSDQ